MIPRQTLAREVAIEGIGLFTEHPVRCVIKPGGGRGIAFRRVDLPDAPTIPATIGALCGTPVHPAFAQIPPRHTALANADHARAIVYTTEHILAALHGLGVTDATIELDAPELPIGDGSAQLFTDAIAGVGLVPTDATIRPLVLTEPVTVSSPDGSATLTAEPLGPGEQPSYTYHLDYGRRAAVPAQTARWLGDPRAFCREIAPARTFSLAAEAAQMQALGMFRSFTPRDLLVIDDTGSPIDNAWRFADEPARHKLLDLIGDLALVGRPLAARITSTRGGHALNHAMARALRDLA